MITYTDVMKWLLKMPKDRVACRNLCDPAGNLLVLYSRDVLNFRGHKASNRCVYTREGAAPMQVLAQVEPTLTQVLAALEAQEDLPLCITAAEVTRRLRVAYQEVQEANVEPAATLC